MQCAAEDGDWYARNLYDAKHWQGRHHRERYGDPKEFGAKDLIPLWKGENWKPDELCALYRKMGATFILAMANHHDNFDNWNSKYQPWNSVNMGPKRDVLGEWSAAAKKSGLRFGASFHAAHAWTWYEVARDYDGRLTREDGKGKWWEGYDPQQFYCHGRSVYAIELAPDGKPPRCPALEANGLKLAKSLKPLPGMPAAHVFE
jgi:alpha-L-fucosidase